MTVIRYPALVWRDSLFWSVHLYAASDWYPLSQIIRLGDEDVRAINALLVH